ncbi:F-box/LRR-repeat protein 2 [Escovopsis weberi]|uniref:F-box/LRR-repeat protein 2 n=1 Tax=Escovopsis weberi TaxID=150374 RepID=A0A0N0RT07_ESCWE|nr:F-box/LRR-repeat protein 2 [Escovopsis weberi]
MADPERIRASSVSKSFHAFCFDGQLWASLDATGFYQEIPASSLAKLIANTGPFLKHLNLRGCVQLEHYRRTEVIAKSCKHLVSTTLEGCRNFERSSLHNLLRGNEHLVHLNLAGLLTLSNSTCPIIAQSCPNLEVLNVSWCRKLEASCLKEIVDSCTKLRDLRAGEIRGFDCIRMAQSIFRANTLERLVLSGCLDLNDTCLSIMMHGMNPEIDILTGLPVAPPRKLRHLDLSRCVRLTDSGVKHLGYVTPNLQGLQLSRCGMLTNAALKPIFATTPELTHLELDEVEDLTDELFSEHLANAPCAGRLEHLSLSYCDNLGDAGLLPVLKRCVRLKSVYLDNTRISDALLAEAAAMAQRRSARSPSADFRARETLHLAVFDCPNVTWAGILEVLSRNAEIQHVDGHADQATYPTEVVSLKCFYGYQMMVNAHQRRVLRGDLLAARKLERKWIDHMRAEEEARAGGGIPRRRRRRGRDAQQLQVVEEGGNIVIASQRARPLTSCCVM